MNRGGQEDKTTEEGFERISRQEQSNKWLVLIAIGIGTLMSALDGSVVNTILPVLEQTFLSSIAGIEWVVTIYLLVLSGLLLSFGRLGDLQGHKKVYVAGFTIFIIGSALCGLANSVVVLVMFRGLQAFGAAMLQANSPAILTSSFPGRQRGQALGLQATMTYLGLTIGPSLGGWLADRFSWRAVFYINVPIGILALLLSLRFITADKPARATERFDFAGALVFLVGLIALLLGLNQGHSLGWTSAPIILLLIAAFASLSIFIVLEMRTKNPMLDFHLFKNRVFTTSAVGAVLNYIGVYSIIFLLPFYLIQGLGMNTARAGLILTAMPVIMAITAPLSGSISDRIGTRLPATLGMVMLTAGLLLLSSLRADTSIPGITLRLAVAGFGIGTFISPNTSALMGNAPSHRQGIASGIQATARNMGMVLGVGLAGAVFATVLGTGSSLSNAMIFPALRASFLTAAFVAGVGIFITAFKPPMSATQDPI
jgi:EmrB/QacA subfamily drug resistance transporter